jgi:hypothetical protein
MLFDPEVHDIISNTVERLDCMLWLELLPEGDFWEESEVMEILTYVYDWRKN